MNEHELVERAQEGLNEAGVQDTVTAAGIFMPRGHFGGAFAGGLVGDSVGGASAAGWPARSAPASARWPA